MKRDLKNQIRGLLKTFGQLLGPLGGARGRRGLRTADDRAFAGRARACLLTMVDDPARFAKSSQVGAYLGLAPRRYQSGEVDRTGRISNCGNRMARAYLYEAAGLPRPRKVP